MWVDGGTCSEPHAEDHVSRTLVRISYCPSFVKQVYKAVKVKPMIKAEKNHDAEPFGESLSTEDAMVAQRGWHHRPGVGNTVAINAKSYRTSEPIFSVTQFPLRTTLA